MRLILFTMAFCLISGVAVAAQQTVTEEGAFDSGARTKVNANFTDIYFGTMTFSGDKTFSGDVLGDGGDQLAGFLQNQVTSTTTTLTAAQCGSTIFNDSTDVLTLPEASTVIGCRFTFMTNNASNFDVNPSDASDTITLLTNAAGDAIRNATVGNFVCLQAVDATNWSQCGILGTWSDVN